MSAAAGLQHRTKDRFDPALEAADPSLEWSPALLLRPNPVDSWLDQVALEMSVDTERTPVVVTLAGTLDEGTATSVRSVVSQLVIEDHRDLVADISQLSVAGDLGLDALVGIQAAARREGGSVTWLCPSGGDGKAPGHRPRRELPGGV
jgi:anti-anti-sigma factor